MPSFDIVSEVDMHEARNAVDQANREVDVRFDFKGVGAKFELSETTVTLNAEVDFQVQQMLEILKAKLIKRSVDIGSLNVGEAQIVGQRALLSVVIQQGIEPDIARKIVKLTKAMKIKVQCAIQGEKVRVTGKKRDDLQSVMAMLKDANIDIPLQYNNFRD